MRMLNFANRNFKELIRDPLSLVFEIVLPIFLLFIFQQFDLPSEVYSIENFTPGIILFGFSFITLFSSTLIAKDRGSSLLIRLGTSPMKSRDYILGYTLSLVPIILIQDVLFFIVALLLGLKFSINILFTILVSLVVSLLFITLGILIGSLVSEKASGGVGSIIVQLVCFTSGMYFPKDQIGKGFNFFCNLLPFESTLNIIRGVLSNNYDLIDLRSIITFLIYFVLVFIITVFVFKKKMVSDNK